MNALRKAMTMRGMRAVDLARETEISTQHLNQYLSGARSLGPKLVQRIGQVLSVSEAYLRGAPQRLAVCDYASGETAAYAIMEEVVMDRYGVYYIVDRPDAEPLAVILADGVQFTTRDWGGPQPLRVEDIGSYRWVDADGRYAEMREGLPRRRRESP